MRQLQQMAQDPHDSEMARSFASIIAHLEHDLLDAVEDLHDALGVEDGVEVDQTVEERVDALLNVADAAAGGDFEAYWFGEVAGFENPEEVADFAKFGEEEWHDQIDDWEARYRRKAPEEFEDKSAREIAAWHVEETFGVPLAEFEREVIGYTRRGALKAALAGNLTAGIEGVRLAARHARTTGVASDSSESATTVADQGGDADGE